MGRVLPAKSRGFAASPVSRRLPFPDILRHAVAPGTGRPGQSRTVVAVVVVAVGAADAADVVADRMASACVAGDVSAAASFDFGADFVATHQSRRKRDS